MKRGANEVHMVLVDELSVPRLRIKAWHEIKSCWPPLSLTAFISLARPSDQGWIVFQAAVKALDGFHARHAARRLICSLFSVSNQPDCTPQRGPDSLRQ